MTYLLLRFSTLGNVAMTVPVIASASKLQPNDRFVVVAEKRLEPMFYGMANVEFHEVEKPPSVMSMFEVYRQLAGYKPDVVIDLQDNIYTRVVCGLFRLRRVRVHKVSNGRWQKAKATLFRGETEVMPTEFERYARALEAAGLKTDGEFRQIPTNEEAKRHVEQLSGERHGRRIGIAPFAKHRSNILPYRTLKRVIAHFAEAADTQVYLFGAGEIESEMLRQWSSLYPNTTSIAGQLKLEEELELMRQLDIMICMDSANQHLSSLVGLRAISIWLGTHPALGFYGWRQRKEDCIQSTLPCRPCTVHGRQNCRYLNFACQDIKAETIINKAESALQEKTED